MAKPPVKGKTDDRQRRPYRVAAWRGDGESPPGGAGAPPADASAASTVSRRVAFGHALRPVRSAPGRFLHRSPTAAVVGAVRARSISAALVLGVVGALLLLPAGSGMAASPGASSTTSFARFGGGHSFGGGGGLGRSHGFFGGSRPRRGFGFGSRPRRSHGILRRIAAALAFAYLFHLLFSGGHGIILILLIVGAVALLVRRRRRRTAQFG